MDSDSNAMTDKDQPHMMTREQARTKLDLLPLLISVSVEYSTNMDDDPVLEFSYHNIPGPGESVVQLPLSPSEVNLRDLVNNLPLAPADKLAALAIMLSPPQA